MLPTFDWIAHFLLFFIYLFVYLFIYLIIYLLVTFGLYSKDVTDAFSDLTKTYTLDFFSRTLFRRVLSMFDYYLQGGESNQ